MLEVKALSAGYPGKLVLQNICLTAHRGAVTVILGPNGCGKSTLLKALCGILPGTQGKVLLNGEELLSLAPRMRAQKLAYLAQTRQAPEMTVRQLVLQGRFPYLSYPRRYRKADLALAQNAMEEMDIWQHRDTLLERLSGGQQQKAYIAMALTQASPVMLLDEPTTYLDISHQLQLLQITRQLAQQGKTVVMVMHDLPHALQLADQLVVMASGEVVAAGAPEEIYASGILETVFRVKLGRSQTESGWRYYCENTK